jgi:NinB protein
MSNEQTLILANEKVQRNALTIIANLPVDGTMQVVIGPKKKVRTPDQNSLMWVGPLADISEQAWFRGKQYTAEYWHEIFKRMFLPEGHEEDFDRMVTKEWKGKWEFDLNGDRMLIGSTTQLTTFGMSQFYMPQVEAFASQDLGVRFHVRGH